MGPVPEHSYNWFKPNTKILNYQTPCASTSLPDMTIRSHSLWADSTWIFVYNMCDISNLTSFPTFLHRLLSTVKPGDNNQHVMCLHSDFEQGKPQQNWKHYEEMGSLILSSGCEHVDLMFWSGTQLNGNICFQANNCVIFSLIYCLFCFSLYSIKEEGWFIFREVCKTLLLQEEMLTC